MKPISPSMSLAYSIRKKAGGKYPVKKDPGYAGGGEIGESDDPMVVCSPSSVVHAIRAKKMAAGGEVDDDFLSDEEDTALPDESEAGEEPATKRKRLLSKAFEMVRNKHSGK